jgi:N-acetylneuraminic acid mutarotase
MITISSNEIYQLDPLTDGWYKLVVNSNAGLLTAVIA